MMTSMSMLRIKFLEQKVFIAFLHNYLAFYDQREVTFNIPLKRTRVLVIIEV